MTGERELPKGWRWVRLGEVGQFDSGGTPAKENQNYWGGDIPFVTGADITAMNISARHARTYLTKDGLESGKTAICYPNTVLFVTRTRVGRVGIATEIMGASQDLSPFVCGPKLLPEYVYWYLQSIGQYLISMCRGSTIQGLTRAVVDALQIPLAPIDTQRQIAALLTEQMAAVERARAAAEAQLAAARGLAGAYLRKVFEGEEARGWPRTRLGEAAHLQRGRFSPRPRNDPRYFGGPYPWIQIGEVEAASKYITTYTTTLNELGLTVSKMFPKGTLVISIAATIGAVGILGFDSCMPDSLVGITPVEDSSDTEYFYYLLTFIREHLESIAPQMAQANLKLELLEPLEIPMPPLEKRKQITAQLATRTGEAERLCRNLADRLSLINGLPAALLRRAFNGEL